MSAKTEDLLGRRFGRLVVVEAATPGKRNTARWTCECDCGQKNVVYATNLKRGFTTSCGCFHKDKARVRLLKHGESKRTSAPPTNLYSRWSNMKRRCYDPTNRLYYRYGGRGIKVYGPWVDSFMVFRDWLSANLGPCPAGHSLDRIDNNRNYEPGNLRWADHSMQVRNSSRCLKEAA